MFEIIDLDHYETRGDYTDITLVVDGKRYRCHKFILARASRFFDALFSSPFKERDSEEIVIGHVTRETFEVFLDFAYHNKVDLKDFPKETWTDLYEMARFFDVEELQEKIPRYMKEVLKEGHALFRRVPSYIPMWVNFCHLHCLDKVLKLLWMFVEEWFLQMETEDILLFNYEDMVRIVQMNGFMYGEEKKMLENVLFWTEEKREELKDKHIEELLSHVRYGAINDLSLVTDMMTKGHIGEETIKKMTKVLEEYQEGDHLAMEIAHRPYFTKRGYDQMHRLRLRVGSHLFFEVDCLTQLPDFLQDVEDFAMGLLGQHIFFIGGRRGRKARDSVYVYSIVRNCWTFYCCLTVARYNFVAVSVVDRLFILGGRNSRNAINAIEEIGPRGTWMCSNGPPFSLHQAALASFDGDLAIGPMSFDMYDEIGRRQIYLFDSGRWKEKRIAEKDLGKYWMTGKGSCTVCRELNSWLWVEFDELRLGHIFVCPHCLFTKKIA